MEPKVRDHSSSLSSFDQNSFLLYPFLPFPLFVYLRNSFPPLINTLFSFEHRRATITTIAVQPPIGPAIEPQSRTWILKYDVMLKFAKEATVMAVRGEGRSGKKRDDDRGRVSSCANNGLVAGGGM